MYIDDYTKACLKGILVLFTIVIPCVSSVEDHTGTKSATNHDKSQYSCHPVTYITPPKSDRRDALMFMNERLRSISKQMQGMSAHMDRRLVDLYDKITSKLDNQHRPILPNGTQVRAVDSKFEHQTGKVDSTNGHHDIIIPVNTTAGHYARPPDCATVQKAGATADGVYRIFLDEADREGTLAYCDLTSDGGGWTVFQRRQDGSVNFYRDWEAYRKGFGNLHGEFWFGNDNLHRLTDNSGNKLRIDMKDWRGHRRYASYGFFYVEGSGNNYRLTAKDYTGDAGNSLKQHDGKLFSTRDRDQDLEQRNCAREFLGGWWYSNKGCFSANLNGPYVRSHNWFYSVWWSTSGSDGTSVKYVTMKVRPYSFTA